jgi:hypothetical protein
VLRKNVVTGVPEVLSRANRLPTPCGYLMLKFVQFLYKRGTMVGIVGALLAAPTGATSRTTEAKTSAGARFTEPKPSARNTDFSARVLDAVLRFLRAVVLHAQHEVGSAGVRPVREFDRNIVHREG